MRMSVWSSDVCSSDLRIGTPPVLRLHARRADTVVPHLAGSLVRRRRLRRVGIAHLRFLESHGQSPYESESRRLGPCPEPPPPPPRSAWAVVGAAWVS